MWVAAKTMALLRDAAPKQNVRILMGKHAQTGSWSREAVTLWEDDILQSSHASRVAEPKGCREQCGHALGLDPSGEPPERIRMLKSAVQCRGLLSTLMHVCVPEHMYDIVLHENGVVRFVAQGNDLQKLLLLCLDSESTQDAVKNGIHAKLHGCFCFGVMRADGSVDRYNRWAEDCKYAYTIATAS